MTVRESLEEGPLPGVEQTWWASTVSVEKESYWLEPPHEGVLLGD